jgi:gamma-glutamylaminecyclotransferase
MKVFVYGTLRRGQTAHHLLRGARFIDTARTEPEYTLLDMGTYPALVSGGETAVLGEIYEIEADALAELDRYEDAPRLYRRVLTPIGGHEVFVYLLCAEPGSNWPKLPHGDWCGRS